MLLALVALVLSVLIVPVSPVAAAEAGLSDVTAESIAHLVVHPVTQPLDGGRLASTAGVQISAGLRHTCGLHVDGTVTCWGVNSAGQATPPSGTFTWVSAGGGHTCGLRSDGTVACWGSDGYGQATPPTGIFTSVSAGQFHTCGLRSDGTVACWGRNNSSQATPPTGTFTSVSAGDEYSCGVRTEGTVACWGRNNWSQATPPTGTFTSVSAGGEHACGVHVDGTITCWGLIYDDQSTVPPGTFTSVSAGSGHTCGLRDDRTVACWGEDAMGQSTVPTGTFTSVSAGDGYSCGVRADGTVACWGSNELRQATPPSGGFVSVATSGGPSTRQTCGLRTDGTVACWGSNEYGETTAPIGSFTSVSAGSRYSCGVRADGTVACWGDNEYHKATPPTGTFTSVSAGDLHTCGLRTDGTVACWGADNMGQSTPPTGTFTSVSAGYFHTCGVRTDGTVACWGLDASGQATPPTGTFTSVSAGDYHTCAVRTNGNLACWGDNEAGQATPPTGTFNSVSAGLSYSCGVRSDGTIVCWGPDGYIEAAPSDGIFTSVSAGNTNSCAVRTDGVFQCWGLIAALGEPFGGEGPPADPPSAPTKPTAVAREVSAAVFWTAPPSGGSPIVSYSVRAVEDSSKMCFTTGALSCVVMGLTDGISYTFSVRATNAQGDGPWSDASDPVTPTAQALAPAKPGKPIATPGNAQATISWTAPYDGGSPITGYTVTSNPGDKTCSTTGELTCTVVGLTKGTPYTFRVTATNIMGAGAASEPSDVVIPGATWFHPIEPTRLIDPRPAWKVGPFSTPWNQGTARDIQVTGEVGVPVDAKAVVLNVTVTDVTAPGGTFISVYPKGGTRPNVSSLNAASGQTIANSVTTKIGDGGKITIYNEAGKANVIVDVAGYYAEGSGDGYTALSPTRVIDSRPAWKVGPYSTPWSAKQSRDVTIDTTNSGVPTGADAVVLNVTATDVTQGTFISVYPKGTTRPNASNLNLAPGNTIANQVVVKLGTGNQVSVYNEAGKANVIVDVVGYYASGSGDAFYPVAPQRIVDPRPAWQVGPFNSPWGNQIMRPVQVTTNADVPASAKAVVMNVTATDVTSPIGTFVTVFPDGTVPNASSLNAAPGWTIANAVTAKLSTDGMVSVYNEKPTANIIVDVNGYFG